MSSFTAVCLILLVLGILADRFMITSDLVTDLFRCKAQGMAPFNSLWLDLPKKLVAEVRRAFLSRSPRLHPYSPFSRSSCPFGDSMQTIWCLVAIRHNSRATLSKVLEPR